MGSLLSTLTKFALRTGSISNRAPFSILKRRGHSAHGTWAMVLLCCAAGAQVRTYEQSSDGLHLQHVMSSLNAEVTCARYNHNGKIIASCSVDGGICLDVAASGELLSRFFYPAKAITDRRVNAVHFSSGSRFLASGGNDGCVRVWDLKTQEVTQSYSISASAVTSVNFSGYKDDFIVAGSESGAISVCDVQSAETLGFLSVDPKFTVSSVTSVQSSPHPYARQLVGSTYGDGSVRVWDLHTGQLTAEFAQQHDAAASCLAISPVSKVLLASGGHDRRVLFFDTLQRRELRCIDFDHPVSSLALCADGKTIAVGTLNGGLLVYDLRGVITPLCSVSMASDGNSGGAAGSAINSIQFAPPAADSLTGTVFPQGQPVITTERNAGPATAQKSAERGAILPKQLTVSDNNSNNQGVTRQAEVSTLLSPPSATKSTPPTRPNGFTISTNPPSAQPETPPNQDMVDELTLLQQHQQPPTLRTLPGLNASPVRLRESPTHASRHAEPSLLSLLAESSPTHADRKREITAALPLTSPTSYSAQVSSTLESDRQSIADTIGKMQQTLEAHHQEQQQQLETMLKTVLTRYDTLLDENLRLKRENESLKAHIQQNSNSIMFA